MLYDLTAARRRSRSMDPPAPFAVYDEPPFDAGFLADLQDFLAHRSERFDPRAEIPDYARLEERALGFYSRLQELLPDEDARAMLMDYSDLRSELHGLEVTPLCERAFYDGVRFMLRAMRGMG